MEIVAVMLSTGSEATSLSEPRFLTPLSRQYEWHLLFPLHKRPARAPQYLALLTDRCTRIDEDFRCKKTVLVLLTMLVLIECATIISRILSNSTLQTYRILSDA